MDSASLERLFCKAAGRLQREQDALRQTVDRIDQTDQRLRADGEGTRRPSVAKVVARPPDV
jgi:hypothetical protein